MSLALSLTGFDVSNPIPGIYAELRFAQGAQGGDIGPKKVLVLAPKTSAGTITVDTQIVGPINDEADAITWGGVGSIAHAVIARILAVNPNAQIYLGCPTAATGTAAVEIVTVVGTATSAGLAEIVIQGQTIQVGVASGDTPTVIATALKSALNNVTGLQFTAANVAGVITITARTAGEEYNSVRIRCRITATSCTISPTADTAFGSSGVGAAAVGTGTISYTAILATILGTRFHYIVPCSQVAGPLAALMAQVNTQAEPTTGFRQKVVAGACLTPANAATLASGASLNVARARLVNEEEGPEPHYLIAAEAAGIFSKIEPSDPSHNFDGYGLHEGEVVRLQRPYNTSAIPTTTELKLMLNNGVTPIGVSVNGQAFIVRSVTTYCLNGSNYDYRVRDSSVVTVGDAWTDDTVARIAATPWTHVTSDPVNVNDQPAKKFVTPKRMTQLVESSIRDYVAAGHFDPAKLDTMIAAIACGQDPVLPSRLNTVAPIYSATPLHQHALLVKESSPAALPTLQPHPTAPTLRLTAQPGAVVVCAATRGEDTSHGTLRFSRDLSRQQLPRRAGELRRHPRLGRLQHRHDGQGLLWYQPRRQDDAGDRQERHPARRHRVRVHREAAGRRRGRARLLPRRQEGLLQGVHHGVQGDVQRQRAERLRLHLRRQAGQGVDAVNPLDRPASGGNGPPTDVPASAVVMELISRGRPPSVVMDFPRHDERGRPFVKIRLRLLSDSEVLTALANARTTTARMIGKSDLPWRPEEMEHNTRAVEILAIACRKMVFACDAHPARRGFYPHACPECAGQMAEVIDAANIDPPLFEHGAWEASKYFSPTELGVLMNAYASLQARAHPQLSELTEDEVKAWIAIVDQGLNELPFSYFSRDQLETFAGSCARSVAELERQLAGLRATSSSPSDS